MVSNRLRQQNAEKPLSLQIDVLYAELAELNALMADCPENSALEARNRKALAELRDLQEREARIIEREFIKSLQLPLGAGTEAINNAD